MSAVDTIRRLPGIFGMIESGKFLPMHSYHMRARNGKLIGISGVNICYPLKHSCNATYLKRWLLDIEDKKFYEHGAVDYKSILRAVIRNLSTGRITQGGSTITQQLARTLFLDASRTWIRKLSETVIAFKIERHLTKDEILSAYCDFVYLGRGSRGFEAASRAVYRRSFENLDPDKIPALIGLLGAPERFHPENDQKKFWNRAKQKSRYLGLDIDVVPLNPIRLPRNSSNKRIENAVRVELSTLGLSERGIKSIELTIDEVLQRLIDHELREISKNQEVAQVSAVVVCNKTGDVLAESAWSMGKSSEFSPNFFGRIQPGSTFKTFALLSAMESGLSVDMTFDSSPYISGHRTGNLWRVRNYGDVYHGHLALADAFVKSDNTVFARLADFLDDDDLASTYERFSLVDRRLFTRSAVLGGVAKGLSLLKITNAYAAIARNGVAIEPRLIRFVHYHDGQNVFLGSGEGKVVAEYEVVQQLKKILSLSGIRFLSKNLPGKTGTTSKGSLFVGYNDDVSIGLWLDFNREQSEHDPKALSARQLMKKIGQKLLAWSDRRALAIF